MTCLRLESCNIDPVLGLLLVICLFTAAALLLGRDRMGTSYRRAVDALLQLLINLLTRVTRSKGNDQETLDQ